MATIVEIPNDIRDRVYQRDRIIPFRKKFTDRFFNGFTANLQRINNRLTTQRTWQGIQINPGVVMIVQEPPMDQENTFAPEIELHYVGQNENLRATIEAAIQDTFDTLRQEGGKRKSKKTRKSKKERKARKTRGRK